VKRSEKEQLCQELHEVFQNNTNAVLVGFSGLTVNNDVLLRSKLRDSNCSYRVVKNTIAKIAAAGTPMEAVTDKFVGTTAIAYNESDPITLAKVFKEFAKDVNVFDFKAVLVEGKAYPGEQLDAIAAMPGREELIAKLLFLLTHPVTSLARVLNAPVRNLGIVLNEIKKES
jgi:large subunit ribosomal protein L10